MSEPQPGLPGGPTVPGTALTSAEIRARALLYLSPEVAACASLTIAELTQYGIGTLAITPEQETALARRMRLL